MKGQIEIGHLTKYDVFRTRTETKLWTLKCGSKSIQTSLIMRKRPPKPYKLLKLFYQFCDSYKIPSCSFYLTEAEIKFAMFAHFKECHGNHKKILAHAEFRNG